jgi:xylulokinase
MSYLGLDIGSTGCKALVFNDAGRELSSAYREYPVLSPREGWAEIDSRRVIDLCCQVVRQAARGAGRDRVRGLCVSSQGEAFTPVGPKGEILGNAMLSFDTRSSEVMRSFGAKFGLRRLYRITGHTAHPMFTLFKLLWLKRHRRGIWAKTPRFHCFEDLFHLKLGLEPAISWPMAGRTMLFDVQRHAWDAHILRAAGIRGTQLPRTLPAGAKVGIIPAARARSLGLPPGVVVAAGGHDQTCAALGAGITSPGKAIYATGTTECICPAFARARFGEELFSSNLCTYDYTVKGMYTTVAFSLTGGNILQWFRDQWGSEEVREAARRRISPYRVILSRMPPNPTHLMVLPYFTPTGTPHFDPSATGAILGLRLTTTRGEVLRALLEGVAFEIRLNIEILERSGSPIRRLLASGGGSRSKAWTQLKADVIGKPITTVKVSETGCLGAAILARHAVTGVPLKRLARMMVKTGKVIRPRAQDTAYYRKRFVIYKQLYPKLRDIKT